MAALPRDIDNLLSDFSPAARERLKEALVAYDDFGLALANGHHTYLMRDEIIQVIQWRLLPKDLRQLKALSDGEYRTVWQNGAYEPGWRVVYDYGDDEGSAQLTFEGKARAFDRADMLLLLSPEGEVVDTFDVLADSHYSLPEPDGDES